MLEAHRRSTYTHTHTHTHNQTHKCSVRERERTRAGESMSQATLRAGRNGPITVSAVLVPSLLWLKRRSNVDRIAGTKKPTVATGERLLVV